MKRNGWLVFIFFCLTIVIGIGVSKPKAAGAAGLQTDYLYPVSVISDDPWKVPDTKEIQEVLDDLMLSDNFNFETYVKELISGERTFSFGNIARDLLKAVGNELEKNKNMIARLVLIAVIAAVFTNFSSVFQGKQISETGFYITYMLLFTVLTVSFLSVTSIAVRALSDLLEFMKALMPAYFVSLAYSTGAGTSTVFYQATVVLIAVVDTILIKIMIPGIQVYFILSLSNFLMSEDRFSKLIELLENLISWGLKTILGIVIGFHSIQGLIVPMADQVKRSVFTKAAGAIPGAGNTLRSVTETVLGAGILVKNAIGAAGLLVIVLICAIPLIQLLFYTFIYQFSAAIVQPISDKRIISCISAASRSSKMLMFTVLIGAVMFLFSIMIVTAMTR